MKLLLTSWDEVVTFRLVFAARKYINERNLFLLVMAVALTILLAYCYLAIRNGVFWFQIFSDSWLAYKEQLIVTLTISLASVIVFFFAGITSLILARGILAADSVHQYLQRTKVITLHAILTGCATFSLGGIYVVTDGLFSMTRKRLLPLSIELMLISLLCMVAISLLRNAHSRLELASRWLPLIHLCLVVWALVLLYYSTIGNVVDVVR